MASIKDKGEVFRVMLQGHETKQKRMFIKHENSVLDQYQDDKHTKAEAWPTMWHSYCGENRRWRSQKKP